MNNTENKTQTLFFQIDVKINNPSIDGPDYVYIFDTKNLQCQNGLCIIPKMYYDASVGITPVHRIRISKIEQSVGDSQINFVEVLLRTPYSESSNLTMSDDTVTFETLFFNGFGVAGWTGRYLRITRSIEDAATITVKIIHGLDIIYSPYLWPSEFKIRNYGS